MHRFGGLCKNPLKPLSVPLAGRIKGSLDLSHYSATELFLYVAQAKVSHTPLLVTEDDAVKIGDICRMLDGLPLAIRIVASKFSKLSFREIYEKVLSIEALTLRNEDSELKRQQTLLETFNWSYDLLSPEQQNLFRTLAVFVGGCNYDAAKAVCEKGEEDIGQLIDSNLLEIESRDGASRLYMLRTIYEYAQNKLRDKTFKKQAEALRRRHRNYFFARAEASENKLRGQEQTACFKQLERDWENIQAALEYTFNEKSGCKKLLQFVGGLWWYWRLSIRNRLGDTGWDWLNRLFERPEVIALGENPLLAQENPKLAAIYAKVLYARAAAEALPIKKPKSWDLIREKLFASHQLFCDLADREGIATTIVLATEIGSLPDVEAKLDRAYELFKDINHIWGMAWVRTHQGCTYIHKRDFEQARALFADSIRLYKEVEDRRGVWEVEGNLVQLAQIEKIAKEGFGEWTGWADLMQQALYARIMLKKIDRNIGWQAYIDPNPNPLSFNYERFAPSSAQDVAVRSRQPFPRTFRAIVRDMACQCDSDGKVLCTI